VPRRLRFGSGVRLAVPLCGLVAALVVAPGASASCPSLRHVKAFKGHVTEKVGAVASGDYPQNEGGGTQTIQLGRAVVGADMHLGDKHHSPTGYTFGGRISGGKAVVDDVYEDTGSDYAGELKYNGPVRNGGTNAASAAVGLNRKVCHYKLEVDFFIDAAYQGDSEVDSGHWATFGAFSETKNIPNDLKLGGDAQVKPHPDYPDDPVGLQKASIALNGPWMPDLITLVNCGSPFPTGDCNDIPENPQLDTPASISWHLHPVFKK
jgi:hypothetical protein